MKVPVSILIPIRNEEKNLDRCLKAVCWADEIVIVDSQSCDGSLRIAEAHGANVFQFHFNGVWPKKKNWALDNVPFANEWVFIVDADEILPAGAEAEIREIVTGAKPTIVGYWVNRRFMFMGQWLRHAYYPNWNLRLFRHQHGRYEKLTDSATESGDNEVHEHIIVAGETGRLQLEMDHYAFPSIEAFVEKHNRYSNWEARVELDRRLTAGRSTFAVNDVSFRRKLKKLSHSLPNRPLLRFLYIYIWQRGFLDGKRGYYFARLHAFYEFLCVLKTREAELGPGTQQNCELPTDQTHEMPNGK